MKTHIIIPARLNSTRLPGKLLEKINGKTLIEHVCQILKKSLHVELIDVHMWQKLEIIVKMI